MRQIVGIYLACAALLSSPVQVAAATQQVVITEDGVQITNPELTYSLCTLIEDTVLRYGPQAISAELQTCYQAITEGQTVLPAALLEKVTPELVTLVSSYLQDQGRAPRPSSQPALVGPGCGGCDLTTLLEALEQCCSQFKLTFSLLDTLTVCCSEVFSTLTECCQDIQTTLTVDILDTITDCCNSIMTTLTVDVINTLTLDIIGSVTTDIIDTITTCCNSIITTLTTDVIATITTDVIDSVTECCSSVITTLTTDVIGTVTTDVINTITECCSSVITTLTVDVMGTITSCCTNIINTLTGGSTCCPCTVITQASIDAAGGTYIIATPGNYALSEDVIITGTVGIVIASSFVQLDLCFHKLTGTNGVTVTGIAINSLLTAIRVMNGVIDPVSQDGILVQPNTNNVTLQNLIVQSAGRAGIYLFGVGGGEVSEITESVIKDCQVELCGQDASGLAGLALAQCDNILVEGGFYNRNGSLVATPEVAGISLNSCFNCRIVNLSASNNEADTVYGIHLVNSFDNIIDTCILNTNTAFNGDAYGLLTEGGNRNVIKNCVASSNASTNGGAHGFGLGANEQGSSIIECVAEANVTGGGTTNFNTGHIGTGIFVNGNNSAFLNNLKGNTVTNNQTAGIYDNNSFGFAGGILVLFNSTTLLSENTAIHNGPTSSFLIGGFSNNYLVRYGAGGAVAPATLEFDYSAPVIPTSTAGIMENLDIIA